MTRRAGLTYVCFKSFHLPLDAKPHEIAAAAEKVRGEGLTLYGGGVITMQQVAEIDQAFDYAKAAGMKVIVASPKVELLVDVERKVKQYDIAVAIHNHGPTDKVFPTPESVYESVKNLDKRIGLCIDIGHTVRVGADLLASTEKFFDRLLDVHMKDVTQAAPRGARSRWAGGSSTYRPFCGSSSRTNTRASFRSNTKTSRTTRCPGWPNRSATSAGAGGNRLVRQACLFLARNTLISSRSAVYLAARSGAM